MIYKILDNLAIREMFIKRGTLMALLNNKIERFKILEYPMIKVLCRTLMVKLDVFFIYCE